MCPWWTSDQYPKSYCDNLVTLGLRTPWFLDCEGRKISEPIGFFLTKLGQWFGSFRTLCQIELLNVKVNKRWERCANIYGSQMADKHIWGLFQGQLQVSKYSKVILTLLFRPTCLIGTWEYVLSLLPCKVMFNLAVCHFKIHFLNWQILRCRYIFLQVKYFWPLLVMRPTMQQWDGVSSYFVRVKKKMPVFFL